MKNLKSFFLVSLAILMQSSVTAQSFKDQYYLADDYLLDKNYHKAIEIYLELIVDNNENANLHFKLGYCYTHSAINKEKAIPYLEYASQHISEDYIYDSFKEKRAPLETLFYLGKAYHLNYEFSKAEQMFIKLKRKLHEKDTEFIAKIDHQIEKCNVAKELLKSPRDVEITNVGKSVNSKYSDHSPVVSADNSVIIFTSRRKGDTEDEKYYDGQYSEKIYVSYFNGKEFSNAEQISSNINSSEHVASVGMSSDGTKLLIYKSDDNGSIYLSEKDGSTWTEPQKLPEVVNSRFAETSANISHDYSTFYFTSDRKGGYGGLDIYKTTQQNDGTWSEAVNMGPNINTAYDEEGPYLHPHGKKFFFASKGHRNMGGFDIFVSKLDGNNEWGEPVNVGYPINTPDDQIFVSATADAKTFYFVSRSRKGFGSDDIYRIIAPTPVVKTEPIIALIEPEKKKEDVKPEEKQVIAEIEQPKPKKQKVTKIDNDKPDITIKTIENKPAKEKNKPWWIMIVSSILIGLFVWFFGRKKKR